MVKKKISIIIFSFIVLLSTIGLVPKTSLAASTFIMPADGSITSGYGIRWGKMHHGIDIAKAGTVPIVASASGTVRSSTFGSPGNYNGYGEVVVITHTINGKTYETLYGHMTSGSRKVTAGQKVSQGQLLGYMGSTGDVTGQHVHFEIHDGTYNGNQSNSVNPMDYIGKNIGQTTPTPHTYDGTWAIAKINTPTGGPANKFGHPGYGLTGTLPNGSSYKVYGKEIVDGVAWFDLGNNTWVVESNVDITPYRATIDHTTNVNVYNAPNGAYKDRVTPGSTYKVYGAIDGWYDLGQSTWIKADYVKVTK